MKIQIHGKPRISYKEKFRNRKLLHKVHLQYSCQWEHELDVQIARKKNKLSNINGNDSDISECTFSIWEGLIDLYKKVLEKHTPVKWVNKTIKIQHICKWILLHSFRLPEISRAVTQILKIKMLKSYEIFLKYLQKYYQFRFLTKFLQIFSIALPQNFFNFLKKISKNTSIRRKIWKKTHVHTKKKWII